MTVSVASSPIFFRIASSPRANSDATYDDFGSASLRASIVAARRVRTESSPASAIAIDRVRIFEHRFDDDPFAIFEPLVKAALPARMTGNAADLFDDQKDRVAVAVHPNFPHALYMARAFAFAPELVARARPVVRELRLDRALERFAVHPRQREHAVCCGVLRDRWHEPVDVPANAFEPIGHSFAPAALIAGSRCPPRPSRIWLDRR